MTLQMHVLTIKDTGHILAAVARPDSGVDPDASALAGVDLPVLLPRDKGDAGAAVSVPVPAELLEVKTLVYDPVVIAHPLAHVVDGGRITALPPPSGPITLSQLFVGRVEVHSAVAEVPVVVVIAGKDDPNVRRAQSGKIPAGLTKVVDLTLAILPGEPAASIPVSKSYYMLIAEGGSRLRLEVDTAA